MTKNGEKGGADTTPRKAERSEGAHGNKTQGAEGHDKELRDLPGILVVKTLRFHCRAQGWMPGQGTKILYAA